MIMGIKKKVLAPVIVRYHGKTVTLKLKKRKAQSRSVNQNISHYSTSTVLNINAGNHV